MYFLQLDSGFSEPVDGILLGVSLGKLSLLLFCCFFLDSGFEFLQSLWNCFPVVTYIIRTVTVSDESWKLFRRQTGPVIFHLALFLTVICAANPKCFRKNCKNNSYLLHAYTRTPFCFVFSCLIIVPVCVFAKQLSIAEGREDLSFDNKSIYLPVLEGLVLTTVDESFYKAFCGERRWCLTSPERMESLRTMVYLRIAGEGRGGVPACAAVGWGISLVSTGLETS